MSGRQGMEPDIVTVEGRGEAAVEGKALLRAVDLRCSFGGVKAVDGCSLVVCPGTITGLIGPNGAGKSTFLKILSGETLADSGEVWWNDENISSWPVRKRGAAGVLRTFQLGGEFARLTVLENLLVAVPECSGETILGGLFNRRRWKREEREHLVRARELLHRVGLISHENRWAGELSGGQRRLLEFARAFMARPRLLLLDEPMVGVNPVLRERLIELLASTRAEGMASVIVEHALEVVEALCDDIKVMAAGRIIAAGDMKTLHANEDVLDAYLG